MGVSLSAHYHAVIWLDHHEARIIHFNRDEAEADPVRPAHPPRHLHVRVGSPSGTHTREAPAFYRDVAAAVACAKSILLVGPSSAKVEFVKYLRKHEPHVIDQLSGVETMDKATDGQILARARQHFARMDRMRPRIQ